MKQETKQISEELIQRYPALLPVHNSIEQVFFVLQKTYQMGHKLFCCGNGGSCADSEHIVGELMKSFRFKRPIPCEFAKNLAQYGVLGEELTHNLEGTLPAIALNSHCALTTAFLNDTNPLMTFAQQLYGLGASGDTLLALTTSGNSKNCLYAAIVAKAMGMDVIAFTGANAGKIAEFATVTIRVPEKETYKIQELHLPVYHCLCAMLEAEFFERG